MSRQVKFEVNSCLLIILIAVENTHAILCYQCASTKPYDDNDCINDYSGMVNDTLGVTDHGYVKDCTAARGAWSMCMIETQEISGSLRMYHRGCTDGINFSFPADRFLNITPSNSTTCADVKNHLVCYTLCDTDMCNGPIPPPNITGLCANWTDKDPYDFPEDFPSVCLSGFPPRDVMQAVYYVTVLGAVLLQRVLTSGC